MSGFGIGPVASTLIAAKAGSDLLDRVRNGPSRRDPFRPAGRSKQPFGVTKQVDDGTADLDPKRTEAILKKARETLTRAKKKAASLYAMAEREGRISREIAEDLFVAEEKIAELEAALSSGGVGVFPLIPILAIGLPMAWLLSWLERKGDPQITNLFQFAAWSMFVIAAGVSLWFVGKGVAEIAEKRQPAQRRIRP